MNASTMLSTATQSSFTTLNSSGFFSYMTYHNFAFIIYFLLPPLPQGYWNKDIVRFYSLSYLKHLELCMTPSQCLITISGIVMNKSMKIQRLKEIRLKAYVYLGKDKRYVSTETGRKKSTWED